MKDLQAIKQRNTVYMLSFSELHPDPDQPRKFFEEASIEEMAASIKEYGVLQPVLFRQEEDGKCILVSGERRYRAAQKAGQQSIPAMLVKGAPAEVALIENVMREDLNIIDQAEAMARLKEEHDHTDQQLGLFVGKARSTVTEILSIAKLPDDVKAECRKNSKYSLRELKKVASIKTEKGQKTAFEKYKARLDIDKKPGRKKGSKATKTDVAIKAIRTLDDRLTKMEEWDLKDIDAIKGDLEGLKEKIEELLKKG